jgi:trimeric autotransporter adhesin
VHKAMSPRLLFSIRAALFMLLALTSLLFASCAAPLAPTLDLTPASETLVAGQPLQLTVTRRFPGGSVEDVTNHVRYTTSDRSIALVSERGVITAGSEPGTVIVKAFDASSDATAIAAVTVVEARVTSIDVSPAPALVMDRGTTRGFTATALFNNGTSRDVTSQVLWSSTNPGAANVGNSQIDKGIVSAVASGDTTILATDAKTLVQGRSIVFVKGGPPTLQAILVTPNPANVGVGMTQELSAVGVYSDGSTQNLTKTASWSSARSDVAVVNATGVVTGVAAGDTTISASGPEPFTTVKGSAAAKVVP